MQVAFYARLDEIINEKYERMMKSKPSPYMQVSKNKQWLHCKECAGVDLMQVRKNKLCFVGLLLREDHRPTELNDTFSMFVDIN